jgi:hypothetical protein
MTSTNRRLAVAQLCAAILLASASCANADVPGYFKADTSAFEKTYGPELTARVKSDDLTAQRFKDLGDAVQIIPNLGCPATLAAVLQDLYPVELPFDGRFWLERYSVTCKRDVHIRVLWHEEKGAIEAIPLSPGETLVGVILEKDARKFVEMAARADQPAGCEQFMIVDTVVVQSQKTPADPWIERWTASSCGGLADYDITFTPTPADGGTDISVHAAK